MRWPERRQKQPRKITGLTPWPRVHPQRAELSPDGQFTGTVGYDGKRLGVFVTRPAAAIAFSEELAAWDAVCRCGLLTEMAGLHG